MEVVVLAYKLLAVEKVSREETINYYIKYFNILAFHWIFLTRFFL